MTSDKKEETSSGKRVARSTLELILTDIPVLGWLLVPLFAWMEHRRERRERESGK